MWYGGVMFSEDFSELEITNSLIENNFSPFGAFYLTETGDVTITLTESRFYGTDTDDDGS